VVESPSFEPGGSDASIPSPVGAGRSSRPSGAIREEKVRMPHCEVMVYLKALTVPQVAVAVGLDESVRALAAGGGGLFAV